MAPVQQAWAFLAHRTGAMGRVKTVALVLYHRFGWRSGGYGVCVSMHYLPPTAFFRTEDHRRAHSVWGYVLPITNLGLRPLQLHDVG